MLHRLGLLLLSGALALAAPRWSAPASAADPASLKETLGRVQSEADTKAVEKLIDKLKGGTRTSPPSAAAPPAPAPTSGGRAAAEATSVPAPGPKASPPAADAQPPAPPVKPEEAIERARLEQAPSIDLEIFFAYKSEEITPQAAAALAPLGRALSDPRLAGDSFLIAGHTDAKGGAEYNLALSQRRAEAVRQYLIDTFHLDPAKLIAKGMGSTQLKSKDPLAAENRRVQIVNLSRGEAR
jgi:outer membrane protein OmpA-like peptidoglycan-associated protein